MSRKIKYQARASGVLSYKILSHIPNKPARRGGLKAPTGSGKTKMTCNIIQQVSEGCNGEVLFVFLTIGSGKLPKQAQDDLYRNLRDTGIKVHDIKTACDMYYPGMRNCVLVDGWEKLNHHDKKSGERTNIVMKDGADTTSFISLCKQTNDAGIPIVLVIDEAHIASATEISQDIIDIIDPSYILEVSATLNVKNLHDLEVVTYAEVSDEQMVKYSISTISFPEFHEGIRNGADQIKKLNIFAQAVGANVSFKALAFIPNDNDSSVELEDVLTILRDEYGWTEESGDIKIVLSKRKTHGWEECKGKDGNLNTTKFIITKEAISTGVDIPSISVIVQMRPTNSKTAYLQKIGRGLRMPEQKHYKGKFAPLNTLYYFYDSALVLDFADVDELEDRQQYISYKRDGMLPNVFTALPGAYFDREQPLLEEEPAVFDPLFRPLFLSKMQARDKAGFKWSREHEFRVDFGLFDYDSEHNAPLDGYNLSSNKEDIDFIYTRKVYDVLKSHMFKHEGVINDAVREFVQANVVEGVISQEYIKTFVLNNLDEVLHPLINESLKEAGDAFDNQRERHMFEYLPPDEYAFFINPKKVDKKKTSKCLYEPYYLDDPAKRSADEDLFAEWIDAHDSVHCWWKNYDRKEGSYSITYEGIDKPKTHYPDYVVMLRDGRTFVLEVKSGDSDKEASNKKDALLAVLKEKEQTIAGIVRIDTGWWYLDRNNGMERLDDLLKLVKRFCGECGTKTEDGVCMTCDVS